MHISAETKKGRSLKLGCFLWSTLEYALLGWEDGPLREERWMTCLQAYWWVQTINYTVSDRTSRDILVKGSRHRNECDSGANEDEAVGLYHWSSCSSCSLSAKARLWGLESPGAPVTVSFPGGSDNKDSACNAGDPGSIPGLDGNLLQCSSLENSTDRGACWATVHGVTEYNVHVTKYHRGGLNRTADCWITVL